MPVLLASEVMDLAAAALNDVNKTVYDYDTQLPYLKLALQELQELFELNSLPVTEQNSAPITIPTGTTILRFNVNGPLRLPDNLIEIQEIWARTPNSTGWFMLSRGFWTWGNNFLEFQPLYNYNEILIKYIGSLFPKYVRADTILPVQNAVGYLSYKTAELISDMVEHNDARAQSNGGRALMSLDRIQGITIKSKQSIMARRRPFRAGYKSRITG